MYYSIPAVRSAALLNKEVDMSKLDEVSTVMKRNCTSCPSRMMTQQFDNSRTVERARDRGCRVTQDEDSRLIYFAAKRE